MRDKINDPARLQLIKDSISTIEEFTSCITTVDEFTSNRILCHAVTYNLQCVGEGAYKLSRAFKDTHSGVDWPAIESLRHVLVHDYYSVNFSRIWAILQKDVPALKSYLRQITTEKQIKASPA